MSLFRDIQTAANIITGQDEVTVISHIDADGIAAEALMTESLSRAGIVVRSVFLRQLDPLTMHKVPEDRTLKIFCDLGAGQQSLLAEKGLTEENVLIVDHHVSQPCERKYTQVNSLVYGSNKLSAAGLAYLIAREIDSENTDLAMLGVVGNVGDMMAREEGGLTGLAHDIVEDGVLHGNILVKRKDLNCYGTSTRPLHVCLAYNDDPFIPGISNNINDALRFLKKLGLNLKSREGRWLVWEELPDDKKRVIMSALVHQLIAHGLSERRLFSETYIFPEEPCRTPLRNAQEFATLLNACGRWARPLIGSAICQGDRGVAYREAERMLMNHRAVIRDLLQYILETGVTELPYFQFIHVGDRYPDTIVGIGAGMALSKLNRRKPILIMCTLPEDPMVTKVSMRTNEQVVSGGIDLQQALTKAAANVGGAGGGHKIAAGAFIPSGREQEFMDHVNLQLAAQYAKKGTGHC